MNTFGTPLTEQDIKCLRSCDVLCFEWNDGESEIRAIKRAQNSSTGYDQTHYIKAGVRFEIYRDRENDTSYEKYQTNDNRTPASCYAYCEKYNGQVQTFAEFLKKDDAVTLEWHSSSDGYLRGSETTIYASNGSTVAYKERLWKDALHAIVTRPSVKGDKKFEFILYVGICPDNSARMIKMFSSR